MSLRFPCFQNCGMVLTALMLIGVMPLIAQVDRATLNGTITDQSGAALVGATVKAANQGTGFERQAEVGVAGSYVMPQLPVGTYSVIIEAEGFNSRQVEGVVLEAGRIQTLDAELEVAAAVVQVEVVDSGVVLDRSSAELGAVIRGAQIDGLPINGRNWAGLMLLAPGAINTGDGAQDSIRFVGRSNDDNNWTLDGVDNTAIKDPTFGSRARLVVSMDSIAEFKVNSALYSAESGNGMGGQVNLVTKSGTNDFHGGAFEYFRNDTLDARNVFDGAELPPFKLNQFGGNIGGPIKRNKLFVFGNVELLRQRQSSTYIQQVPSELLRSDVLANSPALKPVIDAYPLGNASTNDPMVDDLIQDLPRTGDENAATVRVDYNISAGTLLFGRWNFNNADLSDPAGMRPIYQNGEFQQTQNFVIALQQTISPSVLNEIRGGVNRVPRVARDFGALVENVSVPGLSSLPDIRTQDEIGTTYSVIDNLSVFRGRHNLKFGGEVRRIHMNVARGVSQGLDYATVDDFIYNRADEADGEFALAMTGTRRTYFFGYAQDEIKLRSNLTLNIGVRYEYYSVIKEVADRMLVFDTSTGDFAPQGTPPYEPDYNNIAPRVSFAWSPKIFNNKTVIRGGYGIYYGPGQVDDVMASVESTQESWGLTSEEAPGLSFPLAPFLDQAQSEGVEPRYLKPGRRDMYSQQWGLSIQQALPAELVLQVGYSASNAHKVISRTYINLLDPVTRERPWSKFGQIDGKGSEGNSNFNALQISLNRRMAKGIMIQGEYMWSHAINDGTVGGGENSAPQQVNDRRAEKGNSRYDIRQNFTANFVWELPFGPGRQYFNRPGVAGKLAEGWDLSAIWSTRTGRALNITAKRKSKNMPDGNTKQQRADLVPGVPIYPENQTIDNWLNPDAFALPAPQTWGTMGRYTAWGPGVNQWDLALQKSTSINENHRIIFRAEFFNAFNRPHFGNPGTAITSSSTFGRITSPMNRSLGTGTARQIQFMLRYAF